MTSFARVPRRTPRFLLPAVLMAAALWGASVHADTSSKTAGRTIVLINPNSNEGATQSMTELAAAAAGDGAVVRGQSNTGAPPLLTTPEDMQNAIAGVVELGRAAANDPEVGAIIVSAFSDPGLAELREAVDLPVFGIGEEVFHEAARDGRAFGIVTVTPDEALIDSFRQKAASLGYADQYRGTRVTDGDPTALVQTPDLLDAALAAAVTISVQQDGAEAVIMGGGPLSASAIRLQPQFDTPLVVAVSAAARAAAAAIAQSR